MEKHTTVDSGKDPILPKDKNIKTVIGLDHNFHVYIHGGRDLMEKCWDEQKQMWYYKLYFKEER